MSHQEIIKQIIAFPLSEQFEIIREVQQNIKQSLQKQKGEMELSKAEKLAIVESLDSSLKMKKPPMNKQEEREIIENRLAEKYK